MDLTLKPQGGRVVRQIKRPDPALVAQFRELPTTILSDCLDRFHAVPGPLHAYGARRRFAGPAVTVEEIEGGNLMSHLALQLLQPGDVLVIDGKGVTSRACWGGLQTFAALKKQAAGVVIDGSIRDSADCARYDLPVFARGNCPSGPHKGWGGRVNQVIQCAGCVVAPGDVVVGDDDGLVIIPAARIGEVLARAREKMNVERAWFDLVEQGKDTADFLGLTRHAEALAVEWV